MDCATIARRNYDRIIGMQQPIPGFLTTAELEHVARLFETCVPPAEIDEHCRTLLAQRGAVTDWEKAIRETRDTSCFVVGHHRAASRIVDGQSYCVLLAQHLLLGRADVLKTSRGTVAPEAVTPALRRLRAQASVKSDYVVAVLDAGFWGATRFAVVERVVGADLRAVVRRNGRLSVEAAAHIASQVAMGLHDIHALGYAYGDLRPDKILVSEGPDVHAKLCDAGIGSIIYPELANLIAQHRAVDFIAPEIFGGHQPTPTSDVYSLGCALYYAVTSKVPFPGGTPSLKQESHLHRYPLDPRRMVEAIDGAFVDLLAAMMAKEPEKRPQSAREVKVRLEPWINKIH
jgi:serine/threonine protein kinase